MQLSAFGSAAPAGTRTPRVWCAGPVVADTCVKPVHRFEPGATRLVDQIVGSVGGNAAILASALALLGVRAALIGRVGDDDAGRDLAGWLEGFGVELGGLRAIAGHPTSATVALAAPDGERMLLHLPGANAGLRAEDLAAGPVAGDWLCLGGLDLMTGLRPGLAHALCTLHARGILLAVDTTYPPDNTGLELYSGWIDRAEVVLTSFGEAHLLTGEQEPDGILDRFHRLGARTVALKLGAEGCRVSGENVRFGVTAPRVPVADTTGAGDHFFAGWMLGEVTGCDLEGRARLATACGSISVQTTGGTPRYDLSRVLRLADGLTISDAIPKPQHP